MVRTPKTDPNIYQVDLVAGLFGAFMLVWISGAQETEYPGDQIEPPTFATLEITAKIDDDGAISEYSLVPAQAVDAACLTPDYLSSLELVESSDIDCPDRLDRRRFDVLNAPVLAYYDGAGCRSSKDTPRKPWDYSYSLVIGALEKSGLSLRGVFQRFRPSGREIMPFFETSPDDPSKSMAEFIVRTNAVVDALGEAILICDPQASSRQTVSLFVVNEDLLDIWSSSAVELSSNFGLIDLLIVTGEGATTTALWTIPAIAPDDPAKRVMPANWDQATLNVTLCAFHDGSRRCFEVNGAPIKSTNLTLVEVPNA